MDKALVIVESPAKARTISKCLGQGFIVESSIGHIRDLPATAAEIPAKVKGESWARLGVNVDDGFKPLYIVPRGKAAQVRKLKAQLKGAKELYLATDVDREGEAIAWHLKEVLKPKCPVKRMTFEEITKPAILRAVTETRDIDLQLVNAQETRRILDRLYGYEVSPVLWKKVRPKLSAGRVQSVATRLVVDRERARIRFVQAAYFDVEATLRTRREPGGSLEARLVELGGVRLAVGKDFEDATGRLKQGVDARILGEPEAGALAKTLSAAEFLVAKMTEKPFTRHPYAPFITSTLQQEAGRKLRFSAQKTMSLAQRLYENGYITYMRTDSTQLSGQAVKAARSQVLDLYGQEFLPEKPRVYAKKAKNAQEAHEAIRPAGERFQRPESLRGQVEPDAFRLYELIWKRTLASQMKDASGTRTQARIEADAGESGTAVFSASGMVLRFPGFLRVYVEGSDDPQAELADREKLLPPLDEGDLLDPAKVLPMQHATQPPARYTEASLIKELEERGIGRPSTYAAILQTIQDRGYVWSRGSALVPTFTAFAVINLLERHLHELVDYDFTAKMEDGLDAIANGRRESTPWLREFYFGLGDKKDPLNSVTAIGLRPLVHESTAKIDAREVSSHVVGTTDDGETVLVRVGRYGAYAQIGDDGKKASLPADIPPDEFTPAKALELIEAADQGDRVLGIDPAGGKTVYVKTGRFGPYVQLGDPEVTEKGTIKKGTKPKMASLWPGMDPATLTLDQALLLLSYPRELGLHPETGEPITVQDGRFGPYVKAGNESRSLPSHEKMSTLTFEEALKILKEPKGRTKRGKGSVIADLGTHPETGAPVTAKSGRFGPYVTDGKVNATIPKDRQPEEVTLKEAVELLRAREEKLREQGKDPGAAGSSRKPKKKVSKKSTSKR